MKSALVAIARMENPYINEWVRHHLNIGFDHVFLYDNNGPEQEPVGSEIEDRSSVTIIPFTTSGIDTQERAYTDCYRNHGKDFDWMAFFDVDEFLVLKDGTDLEGKLESITADNVLVPWRIFTWSGLFSRDISRPVMEDFTETCDSDCNTVKSIVRTGLPKVLETGVSVHGQYNADTYSDIDGNQLEPTIPHSKKPGIFTRTSFAQFNDPTATRTAELNHYWSKSLDEFMFNKLKRGYLNPNLNITLNHLYRYCKKEDVPRVKEYVEERMKQ